MEDKKCRICGLADMENINIFQTPKLPEKMAAVFPIPLYPNDPLPKHICKKCVITTSAMYTEIERALRNYSKWLSNIRSVQPENQYLKVVDSIVGANQQTSQLVSLIAGSDIGERTVCKLFNFKLDYVPRKRPSSITSKFDNHLPESERMTQKDEEIPTDCTKAESTVHNQPQKSLKKPPEAKMTELKSVLELNGCTLTKLKPTIKSFPGSQSKKDILLEELKVDIKEEPLDEYHPMDIEESKLTGNHQVKCKMCSFSCETIEELAIHQLDHLSISALKLSERRFLDKRIRRGRLIIVENKKCIRCLNCWRIFSDNKSILQHWSEGDCDFFCQICGKEFAASPKMLREHIPAAHGISYKSSKLLRPPTLVPRKPIKTEKSPVNKSPVKLPVKLIVKTPVKSEVSPQGSKTSPAKRKVSPNGSLTVRVACNICLKVFANFKARNSHMRAHKHPPFLPDKPPPSLSETLMALNRSNMLPIKDEPLDLDFESIPYQSMNFHASPAASTSKTGPALSNIGPVTKHPRLKVIPQRTSTSVRKKTIQINANPSPVVIKTEPELMENSLQVKSLVDLQDPSVSSQLTEDSDKLYFDTVTPAITGVSSNGTPTINGLSFDFPSTPKDNMNYGQIFTCHPCGEKFKSKLELFRHKRKCTANNLYPCQFCEKHFLTSADLQMHIMLLHKSTGAPQ